MAINRISMIGAGVMGEALISALIKAGVTPKQISIIEKRSERSAEIAKKYSISEDHNLAETDLLLLVVKPQDLDSVLIEIKPKLNPSATIISFIAGKKIETISNGVHETNTVVRVMPNTPALIGEGAAGYAIGAGVSDEVKIFISKLLNSSGVAVEVDEKLIDAVTATSGSGPAYFFAFVESMITSGIKLGLSEADATKLSIQTFIGAAKLLENSGKTVKELRENVTSPNGTTAAALANFEDSKLQEVVFNAMKAARDRSIELG